MFSAPRSRKPWLGMLLLAGWILGAASAYGQDQDADVIASLQTLTGDVQVVQKESGQAMEGRAGLLLRAGDVIVTADQARATIKFRDGSEVRLFQNTRFVLQASKENAGSSRTFKLDLLLRAGALWGLFARQVETAKITTPTATIGVKGTTLRVLERDNKERVGLTEGVIEVTNARNSVELQAGTRLAAFGPQDDLTQKVQPIPYKIEMRADKRKLTFENGAEQVFVTLQVTDVATGRSVERAGALYFRSNYEKLTFPAEARLNERGFARVPLQFAPPGPADSQLNGNVYVWALIDQEDADDTGEGRLLFTIPVPQGTERIHVEPDKGDGQRVQ